MAGVAFITIALVTLIMAISGLALEPANISLIYLLAVLFTATTAGLGPGIVASVLSFLTYNFFFVQPLYVLTVANPPQPHQVFHAPERRLIELLASQAALAVERARLVAQAADAQALVESNRLSRRCSRRFHTI